MCQACVVPAKWQKTCFILYLHVTCITYKNDRDTLQSTVERILNREGLDAIGDICLKTLNGVIDNINKQAQNEILSALHQYVKSTERFNEN